jgi:hypothetical protein
MRSNEARHEAIMQAEDHTNAVQTRTPTAGWQESIAVDTRGLGALLRVAAQTAAGISRQDVVNLPPEKASTRQQSARVAKTCEGRVRRPSEGPQGLSRAQATPACKLSPEDVEVVARRVAEATEAAGHSGFMRAAELAEHLNVSREWVYDHALALGGIRLGTGPRAPWIFDVGQARRALMRLAERPVEAPRQASRAQRRSGNLLPVGPQPGSSLRRKEVA